MAPPRGVEQSPNSLENSAISASRGTCGGLTAQEQADSGRDAPADLSPDLAEILAVWSQLPDYTRRAILDMVRKATAADT